MINEDFVLCPGCGWTGRTSALEFEDADRRCPACHAHVLID